MIALLTVWIEANRTLDGTQPEGSRYGLEAATTLRLASNAPDTFVAVVQAVGPESSDRPRLDFSQPKTSALAEWPPWVAPGERIRGATAFTCPDRIRRHARNTRGGSQEEAQ